MRIFSNLCFVSRGKKTEGCWLSGMLFGWTERGWGGGRGRALGF